ALTVVTLSAFSLLIGSLFFDTPAWIVLPAFFFTVAPQGMIFGNGAAMASQEAREFAGTGSAMLGLGFSFSASIAAPLAGGTGAPRGMVFGNGAAMASQGARDFAGAGSAMLGLGFSFSASIAAPLVGIAGAHSSLPMAIVMVIGCLSSGTCFIIAGRGNEASTSVA